MSVQSGPSSSQPRHLKNILRYDTKTFRCLKLTSTNCGPLAGKSIFPGAWQCRLSCSASYWLPKLSCTLSVLLPAACSGFVLLCVCDKKLKTEQQLYHCLYCLCMSYKTLRQFYVAVLWWFCIITYHNSEYFLLEAFCERVFGYYLSPSSLGRSEQDDDSSSQARVGRRDSVIPCWFCSPPHSISCLSMTGS